MGNQIYFKIAGKKKKLIEGSNRQTHFWMRTIQWLFHQNFVLIEQMVSDKKIFIGISHRVLCKIKFGCGGHLDRCPEMPDTILEEDHPRIISAKIGWDWLNSFRGEYFFLISSPLFLICIISQNRHKFKVHKKSRNIC